MGKKRKQFECRKNGCFEPPHQGGLCKDHHEERAFQDNRREAAIEALHHCTINGIYLTSPDLRNELEKVRKWWHRACDAVNYRREDEILRDEAEFALEWCISLAQEVVDAEESRREGDENPQPFSFQQTGLWERFENLEKGLMSNGVERRD
ncbi:hypothetical protein [Sedimenticola sp.]|uniref:hypothetical protein n=1 Tax=Sedimenticola sp. TaxID=1940285 RepID=UPI003D130182